MIEQIGFGAIGLVLIFSGTRVVTCDNLVRSVLWLALTLSATALLFVSLNAPFIAGIQLLLYTGGVITLMLFGLMLTRREQGVRVVNEQRPSARAGILAAALFGIFAAAIFSSRDALPERAEDAAEIGAQALGHSFLTEHLLAFEVLSVLLLAAMVGAIVLARRRDFGDEAGTHPGRARPAPEASPEWASEEEE